MAKNQQTDKKYVSRPKSQILNPMIFWSYQWMSTDLNYNERLIMRQTYEFFMTNLVIVTGLVCPNRWILSKHCSSVDGFHAGSKSNLNEHEWMNEWMNERTRTYMWLATLRFKPTPPARKDSNNTLGELGDLSWNI